MHRQFYLTYYLTTVIFNLIRIQLKTKTGNIIIDNVIQETQSNLVGYVLAILLMVICIYFICKKTIKEFYGIENKSIYLIIILTFICTLLLEFFTLNNARY